MRVVDGSKKGLEASELSRVEKRRWGENATSLPAGLTLWPPNPLLVPVPPQGWCCPATGTENTAQSHTPHTPTWQLGLQTLSAVKRVKLKAARGLLVAVFLPKKKETPSSSTGLYHVRCLELR